MTFGGGGLQNLMKQAGQMQRRMEKLKTEFKERSFCASAGGEAVKVELGGDYLLKKLSISPEVLEEKDPSMLEDLVLTATNTATKELKSVWEKEVSRIAPGGMGSSML